MRLTSSSSSSSSFSSSSYHRRQFISYAFRRRESRMIADWGGIHEGNQTNHCCHQTPKLPESTCHSVIS